MLISYSIAFVAEPSQTSDLKVLQEAGLLSSYNYVWSNVFEDAFVWADLLSRSNALVIHILASIHPSSPLN